jgi:GntR family transcriptional regulator of vanillate catabolism
MTDRRPGYRPESSQTIKALLCLRELLLTGEIPAGQRLSEVWAADRLAVSRTPVRAALARLEEEGFLETGPGSGYVVRTFTEQDAIDAIEVRGALEGLAVRRAAERGVSIHVLRGMERVLTKIDLVVAKPRLSEEDLAAYVSLNESFHFLIADACGGRTVPRLIQRVAAMPFAHPSGFVMAQSHREGSGHLFQLAQQQHRSVLDALSAGEGARAEALMREHALLAARNLRLALEDGHRDTAVEGVRLIHSLGV